MNFRISKEELANALIRLRAASRPSDDTKTVDTDVYTGGNWISGPAFLLLNKGFYPDGIFIRDMRDFLISLRQCMKESKNEFPQEGDYERYIEYTNLLTTVYDALLERGLKPVPFDTPLTKDQHDRFYSLNGKGLAEELVLAQRKHLKQWPEMVFSCKAAVKWGEKAIPIKIKVYYFEHDKTFPYTAYCNVGFKKIPDDIEWYGCTATREMNEAYVGLLESIIEVFSRIPHADESCYFYKDWI